MNTIGWLDRGSGRTCVRRAHRCARTRASRPSRSLSLALGIGANTAIFQLLDAVRLRSLPVVRARSELVEVRIAGGNGGMGMTPAWGGLTHPQWFELQPRAAGVRRVFAWSADASTRVGRDQRPAAQALCGERRASSTSSACGPGAAASSRAGGRRRSLPRRARDPRLRLLAARARRAAIWRSAASLLIDGDASRDRRRGAARLLRVDGGRPLRRGAAAVPPGRAADATCSTWR